jgi:hypothetical protein
MAPGPYTGMTIKNSRDYKNHPAGFFHTRYLISRTVIEKMQKGQKISQKKQDYSGIWDSRMNTCYQDQARVHGYGTVFAPATT